LHLVGILFPHINDEARSKSHQKKWVRYLKTQYTHLALYRSVARMKKFQTKFAQKIKTRILFYVHGTVHRSI